MSKNKGAASSSSAPSEPTIARRLLQPCNCTAAFIVTITIITVINSLVALVSLLLSFFPFPSSLSILFFAGIWALQLLLLARLGC
jgi:hypothetical protein